MKNNTKKELFSWARSILVAVVLAFLITTFVFEITQVVGSSMSPTLETGEVVFVDKVTYRFSDPKIGDIVVCSYPNSTDKYIKRIVATSGQLVEIKRGRVYVNYVEQAAPTGSPDILYDMPLMTVPEGNYFVLGDNRNDSKDSHDPTVGTIPKNHIIGAGRIILFPFNKTKIL